MSRLPIESSADLTPLQREYLRNLRDYCDRAPTLGRIYRKVWRNALGFLVIAVGGAWILLSRDLHIAAWALGGSLAGAMLRDLGYFRQTVKLWPATPAVLDRGKLDDLLEARPPDTEW